MAWEHTFPLQIFQVLLLVSLACASPAGPSDGMRYNSHRVAERPSAWEVTVPRESAGGHGYELTGADDGC
jgi:hypothetical protein